MKRVAASLIFLFSVLIVFASCQQEPKDFMNETKAEKDARMGWWRDAKFGMFIHWGLYAVPAGEYNGIRVHDISSWIQASANIPKEEYVKYARQFNPTKFNANEWAALAKEAGMKYIVITSKHHDGFALFDSKVSEYDVVDATPYGKDLLAPLKKACDDHNVSFNTYHSILDWHHPSQYVDPEAENSRSGHANNKIHSERKQEFVDYMKAQLVEIIDNYDVDIMWFDGEWQDWWIKEDGIELYNWLRNYKPSLIVNNRVGAARGGMDGFDKEAGHAGDFGTPEQEIPDTGRVDVDWESCMTMNDTWGYKYFDDNWKSTRILLQNLIDIVSKGGNYLLNIGPKADGTIPEESITRLQEMGAWMAVNGNAIYGTTASPFAKPEWGRYTQKPGKIFAHVFDWPDDNTLSLPMEAANLKRISLLSDTSIELVFTAMAGETIIALPSIAPDDIASVILIEHAADL
jgi:alpha-L-fucosidase